MPSSNLSPSAEWNLQLDHWRRELIEAGFTPMRRADANPHLFGQHPNFMTPDVICYVYIDGDPVEISTGMFLEQRLFGITFPRVDGMANERDFCAFSIDEISTTITVRADPAHRPHLS